MAVVSVSIETDTTATNRELPTRKHPVHESCLMPSLSPGASVALGFLSSSPVASVRLTNVDVLTATGWHTEDRVNATSHFNTLESANAFYACGAFRFV